MDPLTKDYPYLTPYAFAENDVIRSIDLDGLEKVIVIGGGDLMSGQSGDGESNTLIQLTNDVQNYSNANDQNFTVKNFSTQLSGQTIFDVYNYIKDNYNQNEPLIIYGYSAGVVVANQISKMLEDDGIQADLQLSIEAALGPASQPLELSKNVVLSENYYQTSRVNPLASRGFPAIRQEGNFTTKINNYNEDGKVSSSLFEQGGVGAHGHMDEHTVEKAKEGIFKEMDKLSDQCENECEPKR